MSESFTDTERMDYLAALSETTQGLQPGEFRQQVDEQIIAARTAPEPVQTWIDLMVEFPLDDVAVRVLCDDGQVGRASYSSEAGRWYVFSPGTALHGHLWEDAFGKVSDIICWQPVPRDQW